VSNRSKRPAQASLFNHLVGAGEQPHVEAGHDQVNEVELGRLLDRKIGGLRPSKILSTKKSAARR